MAKKNRGGCGLWIVAIAVGGGLAWFILPRINQMGGGPLPESSRRLVSKEDEAKDNVGVYLRRILNDPGSYKPAEWGPLIQSGAGYRIAHTYRAKNGFGALMLGGATFTLDSNLEVVSHKTIDD